MIKPINPFPGGILIRDQADIEAIARGNWSLASDGPAWRSGYRRYGAAKLCAMMMVHELQDRMSRDASLGNICVLAVDPGYMSTGLQRYAPWLVRVLISILFPLGAWLIPGGPIRIPDTSARHVLRAAFESDGGMVEFPKGLYFDGDKLESTSDESRDAHKRDMVWKASDPAEIV
ncbi:hypothetical protein INS49_003932 [Diaporthe citri]|uniref:uncharacterized protein n=1 Tax=Diaporthe citri TaxID=83186 RepID=UPI001C7FEAE0|nr:uncharacterized protein INS49_003932 [Diaporthe citri]KAG6354851.1 hypothetical protein INS49_003932 [Diaporthe citri]